jgi:hypothetical protein
LNGAKLACRSHGGCLILWLQLSPVSVGRAKGSGLKHKPTPIIDQNHVMTFGILLIDHNVYGLKRGAIVPLDLIDRCQRVWCFDGMGCNLSPLLKYLNQEQNLRYGWNQITGQVVKTFHFSRLARGPVIPLETNSIKPVRLKYAPAA